ncbi:MAG: glycoside hydrolase family 2 protein [Anaerolineales bacterium]
MSVPRPEYPRPQQVRPKWLNLNGPWEFACDPGLSGRERGLPLRDSLPDEIVVPFCPESERSGIGDVDFHPGVWYRRQVSIPSDWPQERILLHLGAVDHDAHVWLNGDLVGVHGGGYTPFTLDVTPHLRRGDNNLVIHAQDETRSSLIASGKQCPDYYSRRCHYARTTGIWQTVWLEPVPQTYIQDMRLTPNLAAETLLIEATLGGGPSRGTLTACATLKGEPVGEVEIPFTGHHAAVTLPLQEMELWAPGHPTLYDLTLTVRAKDGSEDMVESYFGMRSVSLSGRAILLNGEPLFQRLVLDQGFYPTGIYTAPSDQALHDDVLISQELGFNGARLHQKVFEPRFLYWADREGYLVWDEFPNWGLDVSQAVALQIMMPQWMEVLRRDYNHPSVVGWCPFNETQRDQDPEVIRQTHHLTKAFDRTRPAIDTSGYQHVETDIYDVHTYEQDVETFGRLFADLARDGEPFRNRPELDAPYQGQPYFVSEYGGIWWNPDQRDDRGWGYGDRPRSKEEFLDRYRGLTETLLEHPRICALCYTQLYDIEQEVNGLYTYDRQPKFDPRHIREINEQKAAIEK